MGTHTRTCMNIHICSHVNMYADMCEHTGTYTHINTNMHTHIEYEMVHYNKLESLLL